MAASRGGRDRGISESQRVHAPEPLIKREEGSEKRLRTRDIINIVEFATIITSGFLFLSVFLLYNSAGEFFTPATFTSFASNMLGITTLFIILGLIPLLYRIKEVIAFEIIPAVLFGAGALLFILIPARIPLGIMVDSPLWSPVDYFILIISLVAIGISIYMSFFRRRYILTWFLGLITFIFLSTHELFHIISWTGTFGPYDQAFAALSLALIFTGFTLYLIKMIADSLLLKKLPKITWKA